MSCASGGMNVGVSTVAEPPIDRRPPSLATAAPRGSAWKPCTDPGSVKWKRAAGSGWAGSPWRCRPIAASASASLAGLSEEDARRKTRDLRWALLSVIEETARHAGHAGFIREQIDGQTGR